MYFYKQSEALPTSTIFDNNVEKNIHYHVYFKTSNCLPLCFQVCFAKKFEYVESAQNQADFNIVFLGGKGSSCSFQYVQELYLEGVFGQHNTDCIHWPEKSGHCKEMAISEDCCRTSSVGKVLDCRGGRGLDSRDRTELECLKTN